MALIRHNWLNHQASRRYPLDDNATGTGDDGETRLNDDIIVDLQLWWPRFGWSVRLPRRADRDRACHHGRDPGSRQHHQHQRLHPPWLP